MKMKKEHFDFLENEIKKVLIKYNGIEKEYEKGNFSRSDRVKDLQKRFCFDILFGAGINKWVSETLYPYLNDDHIYTALKNICPKVERKY